MLMTIVCTVEVPFVKWCDADEPFFSNSCVLTNFTFTLPCPPFLSPLSPYLMLTANVFAHLLLCVLSDSGATLATPPGPTWQYVPPVVPLLFPFFSSLPSFCPLLRLPCLFALFVFFTSKRTLHTPCHHGKFPLGSNTCTFVTEPHTCSVYI